VLFFLKKYLISQHISGFYKIQINFNPKFTNLLPVILHFPTIFKFSYEFSDFSDYILFKKPLFFQVVGYPILMAYNILFVMMS